MKILGIRVDRVDMVEALCRVQKYIQSDKPHQIITVNAEILYRASQDPQLKEVIDQADLVTPDGSGVVWAAQKLGEPLPERVTGIDLMKEICKQAFHNKWRLYLLGGEPGVAEEAARGMREAFPGIEIVGCHHGYFGPEEEEEIVAAIAQAAPQVVFVALGAPKQDYFIAKYKERLGAAVLMGVGGSFDVMAGRIKRAPVFMQKLQLEWLWRLIRQPWRCRRMLVLPRFMSAVRQSKRRRNRMRREIEDRRGQLP